jgi:GTP-binding protein EngB required for normal cell division
LQSIFKTKLLLQCFYFVPANGLVAAGGKLYNIFYATKRKLVKHGLFPRVHQSAKKQKTSASSQLIEEDTIATEDADEIKQWLQNHHQPWEVIETKWKKSVAARKKDINNIKSTNEIILHWPRYSSSFG